MSEIRGKNVTIEIGGEQLRTFDDWEPPEPMPEQLIAQLRISKRGTFTWHAGPGLYQMLRRFGIPLHAKRNAGWWRGRRMSEGMRMRRAW